MVRVRKRQIEFRDGDPITVPQVIGSSRMSYDEFITAMSDGGRVASTEVLANFARLERALTQALAEGNRVETPIGTFSVSLGVGERDDAGGFSIRGRNARVNFRPAKSLLSTVRAGIDFELETTVSVRRPIPERVENSDRGSPARSNSAFHQTGCVRIRRGVVSRKGQGISSERPEIRDGDMRLAKLAGCNAMSVGIFAWSTLEPEKGRFEFGWLDTIMDKFAAITASSESRPTVAR